MSGLQGETGAQGARGRTGSSGVRRLLVMFIFVVLAFSFLSFRLTQNTQAVARATLVACERSNANSEAINSFLDILIGFTAKSDLLDPAEKQERLAGYRSAKVEPLHCK